MKFLFCTSLINRSKIELTYSSSKIHRLTLHECPLVASDTYGLLVTSALKHRHLGTFTFLLGNGNLAWHALFHQLAVHHLNGRVFTHGSGNSWSFMRLKHLILASCSIDKLLEHLLVVLVLNPSCVLHSILLLVAASKFVTHFLDTGVSHSFDWGLPFHFV